MINALILTLHPSKVPPILLDKQFSDFTPDITPIILAAHTNNYEIIKLLVQKGVSMPQPHEVGELVEAVSLFCDDKQHRTPASPHLLQLYSDCWEDGANSSSKV